MPTTDAPLVSVRDLHKAYPTAGGGRLEVLAGVDLDVQEGEVVAIVGQSGSGKSTLLHLIGALDRPDNGSVLFRGNEVFGRSDADLARFRNESIGFVFQFHHLLPEFTAVENVAMPALIRRVGMAEARARAMELLQLMGLDARAEHMPSELSGGEQQRVAVARALMNQPALVLADEPTGNLDTETSGRLHEELVTLSRDMGQAFVIVTHNPSLAERADRVLRLEQGRLS
ncbi:MAG: ABC transporter ATP-binding protein [Rhodothermales bacterium]|nr:ABC transporter ATP-binding protein [Rhodothermales bacterium]MBO6780789.1 ABC transporter ATP-binding protein [Rhodothermales bacterium]